MAPDKMEMGVLGCRWSICRGRGGRWGLGLKERLNGVLIILSVMVVQGYSTR